MHIIFYISITSILLVMLAVLCNTIVTLDDGFMKILILHQHTTFTLCWVSKPPETKKHQLDFHSIAPVGLVQSPNYCNRVDAYIEWASVIE